jgi:hypothetical protein
MADSALLEPLWHLPRTGEKEQGPVFWHRTPTFKTVPFTAQRAFIASGGAEPVGEG